MAIPLLYTKYAWLYDIIYREYLEKEVPLMIEFLRQVFREDAERNIVDVLDLACGTGGPTIYLSRHGYKVIGLDISNEMLSIARKKVEDKRDLDISFIRGDMKSLGFKDRFDAVTLLFTSINYILRNDEMMSLFKGVYDSLREGGVFVVDTPNPYRRKWIDAVPSMWRVTEGDTSVVILDSISPDTVSGIVDWVRTIIVDKNGEIEIVPDKHVIRLYSANELRLYAEEAGFKKTIVYGDFVKRENPKKADRLILVAVKKI